MAKHQCPNQFRGSGARGGCYFEVGDYDVPSEYARLNVGHSCVVVHEGAIPVTWLAEIIAIVTAYEGGIPGFLKKHEEVMGGESYALMCDPEKVASS